MPLPELPYDEWFDKNYKYNPLDSMPIATDNDPDVGEWLPELGDEPIEEEETIHEKMYRIATAKYNPFSIGGSESIHDFD